MTWKTVRLELGRTKAYPEGSPSYAYVLHLPLDEAGTLDAPTYRAARERATVRRLWAGEADQAGTLIHRRGGTWAFSYAPGDEDDETIFHLETHKIRPGEYVTITETNGEKLPFKVVSCHATRLVP
jgi:hypothetical protein